MKRITTTLLAGALTAALAGTATSAVQAETAARPSGPTAYGLTNQGALVKFALTSPDRGRKVGPVSGLGLDDKLVGIDFRPEDGRLYGVGDQGGLYTINLRNAAAKQVGQFTVPLEGSRFGVDFNPAVDALRVVSDTGQNLRHNPDPGGTTTMDTTLTTPPATDPTLGIAGVAYTNNDNSTATGTSLYDLDTNLDQVAQQVPANAGTLSPTGTFGVDATGGSGFDILSRFENDRTVSNRGFAILKVNGRRALYSVDVLSGDVNRIARFGGATRWTVDLAVVQGG